MSTQNKIILVGIAALLLVSLVFNMSQCSRNRRPKPLTPEMLFETFSTDSILSNPEGDTIVIKYIKSQKN